MVKENLTSRLSSILSIIALLGGIFFLSGNITGNAVAGVSPGYANLIGVPLVLVGLAFSVIYFRKHK